MRVMGVFERRGNSSSFKGAGATVAAVGVGFNLDRQGQIQKDQFQSFSAQPDSCAARLHVIKDMQLHVCGSRSSQYWKLVLFGIWAPHCSHCEREQESWSK